MSAYVPHADSGSSDPVGFNISQQGHNLVDLVADFTGGSQQGPERLSRQVEKGWTVLQKALKLALCGIHASTVNAVHSQAHRKPQTALVDGLGNASYCWCA